MPLFLTAHTTYSSVQIALNRAHVLCSFVEAETKIASKNYICLVQELLVQEGVSLFDLDFIAAYSGPAPFTTLRVSLASINGLGFTHTVPLIGVNGLECFAYEQKDQAFEKTMVLLNAFSQDLYIGIYDRSYDKVTLTTCMSLPDLLSYISRLDGRIKCVGNGALLYKQELLSAHASLVIPEHNPDTCSLLSVAHNALDQWNQGVRYGQQLVPLYLKNHPAQKML